MGRDHSWIGDLHGHPGSSKDIRNFIIKNPAGIGHLLPNGADSKGGSGQTGSKF